METPSRRSTRSMGASPGGENKTESNASGRRRTTFSTPTKDAKTKEITKMKACKTDSTKKSKKNRKRKSYIPHYGLCFGGRKINTEMAAATKKLVSLKVGFVE
ncbi:hypothetical protein Fot_56265 [Forsythia ovata]|uniref:Uncharacterized protein n=1 Tax=Forsythia ovata TaxID=205694 RepID=A0ABD1P3X0_9LAMI